MIEIIFLNIQKLWTIYLAKSSRIFWDYLLLPEAIKLSKLSWTIFPNNVIPYRVKSKKLLFIHDLGYFYPELKAYKYFDTIYQKNMITSSVKRAEKIITVSKKTKEDLMKFTDVDENKIFVIYEDCHPIFKNPIDENKTNEIIDKYKIIKPFIFFPSSSISPRKNFHGLISAFNLIKSLIPHHLYFTAPESWGDNIIEKNIFNYQNENTRLHRLGLVPLEDMPYLYHLADFAIYPSFLEGFGIPLIEAMSCSCPIITSNTFSLPEVASDAALYVDPHSISDIASNIVKLANNEELKKELIKKGLERKDKFSWEKSTKKISNIMGII